MTEKKDIISIQQATNFAKRFLEQRIKNLKEFNGHKAKLVSHGDFLWYEIAGTAVYRWGMERHEMVCEVQVDAYSGKVVGYTLPNPSAE